MVMKAVLITAILVVWVENTSLLIPLGFMLIPGKALLFKLIGPAVIENSQYMKDAWVLGPLVLIANTMSYLPFTLTLVHIFHWTKITTRIFGTVILLAGAASVVEGVWGAVRILDSWEYNLSTCYPLFFIYIPMLVLGSIAVFESYRMRRSPLNKPNKPGTNQPAPTDQNQTGTGHVKKLNLGLLSII